MQVVFGANGRAGGDTAQALIDAGKAVRVVVRRPEQGDVWKARGAEVAIADLDNVETVAAALKGASGAFLLNPPPTAGNPFERAAVVADVLKKAIRRAGLPKAVVLSSVGAQHASGTGIIATLHQIEAALTGVAPAVAFLRPGYFVETWAESAGLAMSEGILPTFLEPSYLTPMQSTIDVGRAAAELLQESWAGTRIVELSGPQDWTPADVAAAFASVLSRSVTPAFVPSDQRKAKLTDAGVPPEVADALLGMYVGIADGTVAHQQGIEHRRGTVTLTQALERAVAKATTVAAA